MKHTTVKVTRASVQKLKPCPRGFAEVKKFLPAVISTDPEKNMDLAIALESALVTGEVDWWFNTLADQEKAFPNCCPCTACTGFGDAKAHPDGEQLYATMQKLAYVADLIATKEGR